MRVTAFERELAEEIASFTHDPYGFVLFAFPWGEPGTPLAKKDGPRDWQREELEALGEELRNGAHLESAIKHAISSGHGVGKSAFVAWVILWALSTFEDTKIVVTANTEPQLRTKTFPELKKWHAMAVNKHWFEPLATSLHSTDPTHVSTWRVDALTWSEHNTEAFAGLHNEGKRLVLLFDEASAIADKVWETAEGALTDENTEIIWLAFGNPTRNTGRFRECFGRYAHRWHHRKIDSRTVDGTNKQQIQQWIDDYGEDSDFVRVRVRGEFPRAGSMQFIASDVIDRSINAPAVSNALDSLLMGVDVARFGDDESVVCFRRGKDARSIPWKTYRGIDTADLIGEIVRLANEFKPTALFIDETGIGSGVLDRLLQMNFNAFGISNGGKPEMEAVDGEKIANKGVECWAQMRSWLKSEGAIPNDQDLRSQLEGREYGYNQHEAIILERKDDMKKRGLSSPDRADALALTFGLPIDVFRPKPKSTFDVEQVRRKSIRERRKRITEQPDYALFPHDKDDP